MHLISIPSSSGPSRRRLSSERYPRVHCSGYNLEALGVRSFNFLPCGVPPKTRPTGLDAAARREMFENSARTCRGGRLSEISRASFPRHDAAGKKLEQQPSKAAARMGGSLLRSAETR